MELYYVMPIVKIQRNLEQYDFQKMCLELYFFTCWDKVAECSPHKCTTITFNIDNFPTIGFFNIDFFLQSLMRFENYNV